MRRTITCKACGKEFESTASNAKYCSAECKIQGVRTMRKKWEQRHPNYYAELYRQKREKIEQERMIAYNKILTCQ